MERLTADTERIKPYLVQRYKARILTVPFEIFVVDPQSYLRRIERLLETRVTKATSKMMRRQNVPRKMYAEGVELKIYKRCGWQAPQCASEEEEFAIRRKFVFKQVSSKAMEVLDRLSGEYEERYLGGKKKYV